MLVVRGVTLREGLLMPLGLQVKLVPETEELAFKLTVFPSHIAEGLFKVIIGLGLTTTWTEFESLHPRAFPVTVYVVVIEGLAFKTFVKFPLGAHEKLVPEILELAVNIIAVPAQIGEGLFRPMIGLGLTVTCTEFEPEHVPMLMLTL